MTAEYGVIYRRLKQRLAPRLQFNQSLYEQVLDCELRPGAAWLEAGCGWKVLPEWRMEAEQELVARAALPIGCDIDAPAIARHRTIKPRVICSLNALPFKDGSLDLISCNMVMEHVDHPTMVLSQFARALKPGGRLIVHTPFRWGYFAVLAALIPDRVKHAVRPDGREVVDYYPVRYRCNTPRLMRRLGHAASLREIRIRITDILEMLGRGVSQDAFPGLELDDIRACLMLAARRFDIPRLAA